MQPVPIKCEKTVLICNLNPYGQRYINSLKKCLAPGRCAFILCGYHGSGKYLFSIGKCSPERAAEE